MRVPDKRWKLWDREHCRGLKNLTRGQFAPPSFSELTQDSLGDIVGMVTNALKIADNVQEDNT